MKSSSDLDATDLLVIANTAEVSVVDYGGVLALVPVMAKPVRQAAGMLKGRTSLTRALLTEHGRERSRGR